MPSGRRSPRRWLFFLALVGLALAFQGSRGLYSPDEGYYAVISQTMLRTGDFLIPRLFHEPWLDKPPLSLWGIAAGLKLFGMNEWGARMFHGLCFVLTTLLVGLLGRSLDPDSNGGREAVIYVTMLIPFTAANVLTPDTPLVLWTTLAFFCFWKSVEPRARNVVLWKMLMSVAFGLGFLTKGPAALLPAGAMFLFLVLRRRARTYLLTPWAFPALGLFCLVGIGWYAVVSWEIPGALGYFVENELIGRTISNEYARNPGLRGALMYGPVILLGALPWSWFWLRALMRSGRRVLRKSAWKRLQAEPVRLLLTLWIAATLAVLALASSKLPLYALPVFPALALATSRLFGDRDPESGRGNLVGFSRKGTLALAVWAVVLVGIRFSGSVYPQARDMRALNAALREHLPQVRYEFVSIDDHLEGLMFYQGNDVEPTSTLGTPYPFFVSSEHIHEEIEELDEAPYAHLMVCPGELEATYLRRALNEANVVFRESRLPHGRDLFTILPVDSIAAPLTER